MYATNAKHTRSYQQLPSQLSHTRSSHRLPSTTCNFWLGLKLCSGLKFGRTLCTLCDAPSSTRCTTLYHHSNIQPSY
ncbi:hypothetical protein SCLCIDRAFT_591647 [Scleroderma citrinum Foug A]|uniref:Uncharacterized protein n=1 Tax=Scleroderma citrinum Foug A TaxID=1036808 RepID=A0A0C3E8P1_9AGAM|nr:hypothetical protein SCLCIDRAFT_591647 [Scleroderma citrinum Foug A]